MAAGIGPGSFTGLRLALAAARTLAQVRRIPLYGISSLDALAFQAFPRDGTVISLIDARRGELFAGFYGAGGSNLIQKGDYLCLPKEALVHEAKRHPGPYVIVGVKNPIFSFVLQNLPGAVEAEAEAAPARASSIGQLAYSRRHELSGDLYSVLPLYIRPSQAEIEKEKKEAGAR